MTCLMWAGPTGSKLHVLRRGIRTETAMISSKNMPKHTLETWMLDVILGVAFVMTHMLCRIFRARE